MTSPADTMPEAQNEEEARRAQVLHKVYSYLLRIAAEKKAADWDAARNQAQSAAGEAPTEEPNVQEGV